MGFLPYYTYQSCPGSIRVIHSKHLRINVVSPIGRTSLNYWGRIEVVRSHTVDNESGLLRKRLQFLAVELDGNDRCCTLATRPYPY